MCPLLTDEVRVGIQPTVYTVEEDAGSVTAMVELSGLEPGNAVIVLVSTSDGSAEGFFSLIIVCGSGSRR